MGSRPPWTDFHKNWQGCRGPWCNQSLQVWLQYFQGFQVYRGSEFPFSHWLCWSSLQQCCRYRAACDFNWSCFDGPLLGHASKVEVCNFNRSGAITGCAFRSGSNIRSPCWHLELFMEVRRRTLYRSCQYAVFPADGRFVLQAPIVFWCHRSSDQPSVYRALPVAGLKTWNAWREDVRGYNIFPVWIHLSPPAQNVTFQEVFAGHHHLILTASWHSLGLLVCSIFETVMSFKVYDTIWWQLSYLNVRKCIWRQAVFGNDVKGLRL